MPDSPGAESQEGNDAFRERQDDEPKVRTDRELVRSVKPVVYSDHAATRMDSGYVSPMFYNAFSYSQVLDRAKGLNMVVGVGSANSGEGKTTVAANLAVSFAIADEREAMLVDLNFGAPMLHKLFGVSLSPGIIESMFGQSVFAHRTLIKKLSVITAGNVSQSPLTGEAIRLRNLDREAGRATIGLEYVAALRDVLYSLRQQFELIVVDLPSLRDPLVSPLVMNLFDGILLVVNSNQTRREDIDAVFRRLNPDRISGFIVNRVEGTGIAKAGE